MADPREIRQLLVTLEALLKAQGDTNCIRGIHAALAEIDSPDGLLRARSIYATMTRAKGALSDYNVWKDDPVERMEANKLLDQLRQRLWAAFDL